MRRTWVWAAAAVVALALAGGGVAVYRLQTRKPAAAAQPAGPQPYTAPDVTLNGTVQAVKVVPVAAPVAGTVDAMFAEVGQEVTEGQLLARIRSGQLEGAVELATAELEQSQARAAQADEALVGARLESSRAAADLSRAKSDFDRVEKAFRRQEYLLKEGATPRLVYEKAQKEYESARQELENKQALAGQAETRLEQANRELDAAKRALEEKTSALDQAKAHSATGDLVAPVDGVVVARHGSAGDEITPAATDFFQIAVELGTLQATVEPPPPVLARIRAGQPATVHVAEFPEELAGSVREVRGSQVVVEFASPSPAVKPGLSAAVRIRLI